MQENIKYEYKTLHFRKRSFFSSTVDANALEEKLNEYADKGWEVVNVGLVGWYAQGAIVIFKRPATHPRIR